MLHALGGEEQAGEQRQWGQPGRRRAAARGSRHGMGGSSSRERRFQVGRHWRRQQQGAKCWEWARDRGHLTLPPPSPYHLHHCHPHYMCSHPPTLPHHLCLYWLPCYMPLYHCFPHCRNKFKMTLQQLDFTYGKL